MNIKNVWERFINSRILLGIQNSKTAKWTGQTLIFAVVFSVIFWLAGSVVQKEEGLGLFGFAESESLDRGEDSEKDEEPCTVLGLNMHGTILTYIPDNDKQSAEDFDSLISSETIMGYIRLANEDKDIKAIILEVDSGGGLPVAGEEIARAVEESKKPVIGLIRQSGASAAYWAVSSADKIFASLNSDIGGIGITASYSQNLDPEKRFVQLSSGKYKDAFNPNKTITEEERVLMMRDLNIVHENFIDAVAKNRNLPEAKVRAIADGSTMLGADAKRLGLIDEIGNLFDVKEYLRKELGEEPEICWE